MLKRMCLPLVAVSLITPLYAAEQPTNPSSTSAKQATPAERRANIDRNTQSTLKLIYQKYPQAKAQIAKAAGYAVFKTGGVTVFFLGAGGGEGAAYRQGKATYMTMLQGKVGLGLGGKETREVLVFTDAKTYEQFITQGWAADATATAAAKAHDKGAGIAGAKRIADGIYIYQITENGLMAEATVAGSKYSVSKELNQQ